MIIEHESLVKRESASNRFVCSSIGLTCKGTVPHRSTLPRFDLACVMLSGRMIVVENVTRESLVVHVARRLAKTQELDTELTQVFLVSGVRMMLNYDTFADYGISDASDTPTVNIVVTGSQDVLSRQLYEWHQEMDALRSQWAAAVRAIKRFCVALIYSMFCIGVRLLAGC